MKYTLEEQIKRARIMMGYDSSLTLIENEESVESLSETEQSIEEQGKFAKFMAAFSDDALRVLSGEVKGFKMFGDDAAKATEFLKRAQQGKATAKELGTFNQGVLKNSNLARTNVGLYDEVIENYTRELMNSKSSLATQFQGASRADRAMLLKNSGYPESSINKILKQTDNLGATVAKSADDVGGAAKNINQKINAKAAGIKPAVVTPKEAVKELKTVVKTEAAAVSAVERAGVQIGRYGAKVFDKLARLKNRISIKQALLYGLVGYGAYELVKGLFGKDGKNADGILPSCVANLPDVEFIVGVGDVVVAKLPDGVDEKSMGHGGLFFWPNNRAITGDNQVKGTYFCKGTSGGGEKVSATVSEQEAAVDSTYVAPKVPEDISSNKYSNIQINWDGVKKDGDDNVIKRGGSSYKDCSGTYSIGCKSEVIKKVQGCLGMVGDSKFGPKTQAALTGKGFTSFTDADVDKICSGETPTPVKRTREEIIKLPARDITKLTVPTSLSVPNLANMLQPVTAGFTAPSDERQAEIIRGVTDRGFDLIYKGGALTNDEKTWMLSHYNAEKGIDKTKVKANDQEKLRFN